MKIIRRSGAEMPFDVKKIEDAIRKASAAVDYHNAMSAERIKLIADEVAGRAREPREVRFRNAISAMIRHNRRIRDDVRKVTAFYQGDGSMPVPASRFRIETLINPKRNGACHLLEEFGEACKAYRRGECPHGPLHLLQGSTMSLVEDELETAFRHTSLNICKTVTTDFYNYLLTPNTCTTDAEHRRNIDEHIARLQRRFCQNADAFYNRMTDLLSRRRSSRNPRKRRGLHGTRTRTMDRQLDDFKTFLLTNPISEIGQGKTLGARASQFWASRKKEFEKRASLSDERRGYQSAKAVASAYRSSRN